MNPSDPLQEKLVALLAGRRGHFQMESGYHSEQWFQLDRLFDRPEQLQPFVAELAKRLTTHRIDVVCGPMTGGAKLAVMLAKEMRIPAVVAERVEPPGATGLFPVKYLLPPAQRGLVRDLSVAIVDDAISAGSAVRGAYADLLECGARPVALGALFVFGKAAARFAAEHGMAIERIAPLSFGLWLPADCPLCRAGTALEKVSDAA